MTPKNLIQKVIDLLVCISYSKNMKKLNDFLETNLGFTIGLLVFTPTVFFIVGLGFMIFFKMLNFAL